MDLPKALLLFLDIELMHCIERWAETKSNNNASATNRDICELVSVGNFNALVELVNLTLILDGREVAEEVITFH